MQMVLAVNIREGSIYFEPDKQLAWTDQIMIVKGIMKCLPNRPFYIFVVNATKNKIHMTKWMFTGQSGDILSTIFDPEISSY